MWLNLTTLTDKAALVDMSKVLHMFEVKDGTNIYYNALEMSGHGKHNFKHITVKEPIGLISRMVRSKKP